MEMEVVTILEGVVRGKVNHLGVGEEELEDEDLEQRSRHYHLSTCSLMIQTIMIYPIKNHFNLRNPNFHQRQMVATKFVLEHIIISILHPKLHIMEVASNKIFNLLHNQLSLHVLVHNLWQGPLCHRLELKNKGWLYTTFSFWRKRSSEKEDHLLIHHELLGQQEGLFR